MPIMVVFSYLKNLILLLLLSTIAVVIHPLLQSENPIEIHYRSSIIYTTQPALIVFTIVTSIAMYILIRLFYKLLSNVFFLKTFIDLYRSRIRKNQDTIKQIKKMIQQNQYKSALKITTNYYQNNKEMLYYHLLSLLHLGKRIRFLYTFYHYQCGKAIELFHTVLNNFPRLIKSLVIHIMCKNYHTSDTLSYIYAYHLYEKHKYEKALKILNKFLVGKAFFTDQHTFYLFNKLALELEREISGNDDFATQYIENIQNYEKNVQQKIKIS